MWYCCISFAMSGLRGGTLEVSGTRWCRACFGQCMECSCSSDRRIVSRPACAKRPCKPLIQKLTERDRLCETFCPWPCWYSDPDSSLRSKAGVQSLPHHRSWLPPQLHCNLCPPDQAAWTQELLHCCSKVPTDVTTICRFVILIDAKALWMWGQADLADKTKLKKVHGMNLFKTANNGGMGSLNSGGNKTNGITNTIWPYRVINVKRSLIQTETNQWPVTAHKAHSKYDMQGMVTEIHEGTTNCRNMMRAINKQSLSMAI